MHVKKENTRDKAEERRDRQRLHLTSSVALFDSSSSVRLSFSHRNPGLTTRTNCRLVLNAGSRTRRKESTVKAGSDVE